MSRRAAVVCVGALTAVGAAVRFSTLGRQSYWFDELVTVSLVRRSFGSMLSAIPHIEATPYAYYVLAWPWTRLFGNGEVGLRSLSALAGTATIPVAYGAGAALCSRRVGLFAAAVVTVAPFLVWYSQEARSYALFILLSALSVMFFGRVLGGGGRAALAGWAVFSALALATHYFAVFLVAPEAALLLLRVRRAAVVAVLLPIAVFFAELPLMLKQRALGETISGSSLALRAAAAPKELLVGYSFPEKLAGSVAAAVLVAVGFGLVVVGQRRRERAGALLAAGLAAVTVAVPYLLAAVGTDFLTARNLAAAVIPAAVCVAAGYSASRLGLVVGAALCALFVAITLSVSLNPRYGRTDWRGLAARLGPAQDARAISVIPAIDGRYWRYYLPGVREFEAPTARVDEIAVAGLAVQGALSTGVVRPPAPVVAPPPGFTLERVERTSTFTLVLYRALAPMQVSHGEIQGLRLTPVRPGVLLQLPSP